MNFVDFNIFGDFRPCDNVCRPYCDCDFPKGLNTNNFKGRIPELVDCHCGEEARGMAWMWQRSETDTVINGPDITFHPTYSQGTVIVRGEKPLLSGMVHFWEVRVLTPLLGTDVMFGIGTNKVILHDYNFYFLSALGVDDQSWGFSYNGVVQHGGEKKAYSQKFSQGCIVGVYLDRTLGYLEFFLNRRSLGVAYYDIPLDPNIILYPMVCCTAAKTALRLMNSTSMEESLQLQAFKAIAREPKQLNILRKMPGLRVLMDTYWFLAPSVRYSERSPQNECSIEDEAVLPHSALRRLQKFNVNDEVEVSVRDLYSDAEQIVANEHSDSDDDSKVRESIEDDLHFLL